MFTFWMTIGKFVSGKIPEVTLDNVKVLAQINILLIYK